MEIAQRVLDALHAHFPATTPLIVALEQGREQSTPGGELPAAFVEKFHPRHLDKRQAEEWAAVLEFLLDLPRTALIDTGGRSAPYIVDMTIDSQGFWLVNHSQVFAGHANELRRGIHGYCRDRRATREDMELWQEILDRKIHYSGSYRILIPVLGVA